MKMTTVSNFTMRHGYTVVVGIVNAANVIGICYARACMDGEYLMDVEIDAKNELRFTNMCGMTINPDARIAFTMFWPRCIK